MIKILEYKETNYEVIWGYASIVIMIIFSSFANEFVINNFLFDYAALALLIFLYLVRYKSIPIIYAKIILVFAAYNVIHYLIYHDVHLYFIARFLFYISLGFFTIRLNFDKFFIRLEKVIYYGALISLPLFALQAFAFNMLFGATATLQHIMGIVSPAQHDGSYYSNIIFYTVNTSGLARNCGFMFEPGAFGSVLAVAVGLNLIHNNFKLFNKRLIILLLALITTFSTTAFLALISAIVLYMMNKKLKNGIILIPIGAVIILVVFQLPFMLNKITKLSNNPQKQLEFAIQLANDSQQQQSLGRFAGLLLNFKDFKKAPIFGIGGHDNLKEKDMNKWNVNSVNGLGSYLVTFGIVGIFLLIFNLSKTFSRLTTEYEIKGYYFLVLMVLIIAFSFNLLETPLFFAFQICYVSMAKIISQTELKGIIGEPVYLPS